MNKVLPTADARHGAWIICPNCGEPPAQRIDTKVLREIIAASVCTNGHLFVTQWEAN